MNKVTEAQRRAIAKYDKENTAFVGLKLNRKTDADILDKLQGVGNRQGYIKELIRRDICDTESDTEPGEGGNKGRIEP